MGHIKKLHKVTLSRSDSLPTVIIDFFLLILMTAYTCVTAILSWFLPARYKSIEKDIVLITGGGRGIGRLLAVEFAKYKPKKASIDILSLNMYHYD